MSTSVCVCPRWYLRNNTRDLYQFLCTLPTVVARSSSGRVTKSQKEGGSFGSLISSPLTVHWHCTAYIAFGSHRKRPNRSRCRVGQWVDMARGTVCYVGVTILDGEKATWENMCPTSLITSYELRIGLVNAACNKGRRLIASVGRVLSAAKGCGVIAHRGRSLISTIALFSIYGRGC